MVRRGLYIGRFQPPHRGHLEVISEVLNEVDELVIGIGSAQESHTFDNPFTAGERVLMMRAALLEYGVDIRRVYVIPVPDIGMNYVWPKYVALFTPPFTVVYSGNPLVRRLFLEAGYEVKSPPLFDRRVYSGRRIRELMVKGGNWEKYLPDSVIKIIKEIKGVERLREVIATDEVT